MIRFIFYCCIFNIMTDLKTTDSYCAICNMMTPHLAEHEDNKYKIVCQRCGYMKAEISESQVLRFRKP